MLRSALLLVRKPLAVVNARGYCDTSLQYTLNAVTRQIVSSVSHAQLGEGSCLS